MTTEHAQSLEEALAAIDETVAATEPASPTDEMVLVAEEESAKRAAQSVRGRAFVVVPPACGEHLLREFFDVLNLIPSEPRGDLRRQAAEMLDATYLVGPFGFDEVLHHALRAADIPIVLLRRDPRDAACGAALEWLAETGNENVTSEPEPSRPGLDEAVAWVLDGHGTFERSYDACRRWSGAEGVLELRFEDVAGPRRGGDEVRQIEQLTSLAAHIGWRGPIHLLARAIVHSYGAGAAGPDDGNVGIWQEALSPATRQRLAGRTERLRSTWGYDVEPAPRPVAMPGILGALLVALEREHYQVLRDERWAAYWKIQEVEADSLERLVTLRALKARLKRKPVYIAERLLMHYQRLKKNIRRSRFLNE